MHTLSNFITATLSSGVAIRLSIIIIIMIYFKNVYEHELYKYIFYDCVICIVC